MASKSEIDYEIQVEESSSPIKLHKADGKNASSGASSSSKGCKISKYNEKPETRIRKIAKHLSESVASDAEQPTRKRIKTAAMGGSYLDSACRTVCTFIALTAFSFFAFYQASKYRKEHGLVDCYTTAESEQPQQDSLSLELVEEGEEAEQSSTKLGMRKGRLLPVALRR